jgi:hypothetical protein
MTTTAQFQTRPDYYINQEDCKQSKFEREEQTNPRYRDFTHTQFTAGDEEQFQHYRYPKSSDEERKEIQLEQNLFENIQLPIWEKNQNISSESTLDTFRYIFNKFKKGIFIKIVNNQLKVFLPFSKSQFINEWSENIKADPKYLQYCSPQIRNDDRIDKEQKYIYGFLSYVSTLEKRHFNPRKVNPNTEEWFGNNCLVRYENPLSEGENNVSNVKNMLEELCASRQVPDIELFINRRDFPIITKDSTEAYHNLWNSSTKPLVSHNYEKYVPILSYSTTDRYADYLFPTWDDWARVKNQDEGIWFPPSCTNYNHDFSTPWEQKIPVAIFRGSCTGCGTTIETNQRLRVADISFRTEPDENNISYIDAGITKWNVRPRKLENEEYLQTINRDVFDFGLVSFKSPSEQSRHKYIIHIQGHVSAFRLSLELSMGSVILMVDSRWKVWFSDMLKPYEHYVPVNSNMDNLIDQIKWCREHDEQCKQIAKNAFQLYNLYLGKQGIFDYMQKLFVHLKSEIGTQEYFTYPIRTQVKHEYKHLTTETKFPNTSKTIADIHFIPPIGRCYGLLKGVEFISNMFNTNFDNLPVEHELFKSKDESTIVNLKQLANFNFAIKTTKECAGQKELEYIHEAFIGNKVINNLSKHIPNFVYIFGLYRKNKKVNVITEYLEGETLFQYLSGTKFNMSEFFFILVQICFALKVAQNRCGFVHYDLTPWNIVLKRLDSPVSFDYMISHDKIYRVSTTVIPIIIDYGKSHVIHNGYHYGLINMFNSSVSHDIFTLIIKSIDIILSTKKLSANEFNLIFRLSGFLRPFRNAKEIKSYVTKTKRYDELITLNKHELNKDPIDLVNYIMEKGILRQQPFEQVDTYNQFMNHGNPRQVFDYILSSSTEERLESYVDVIKRFKNCTLPQSENIFVEYYTVQTFENNFQSLFDNMVTFSKVSQINIDSEIQLFNTVFSFIQRVYKVKIDSFKNERIEFDLDTEKSKTLIKSPYTDNTFQNKSKIMKLLTDYNIVIYEDFDLTDYRDIVEMVFCYKGKYELNEAHKQFYFDNFKELLEINPFNMMNNNANIKTLIAVSNVTYKLALSHLTINY